LLTAQTRPSSLNLTGAQSIGAPEPTSQESGETERGGKEKIEGRGEGRKLREGFGPPKNFGVTPPMAVIRKSC